MNRALCAIVLGLAMVGCAAGVDDGVPDEPGVTNPTRPPATKPLGGRLDQRPDNLMLTYANNPAELTSEDIVFLTKTPPPQPRPMTPEVAEQER